MTKEDATGLRAILRWTAENLRRELDMIRKAYDHNGIKGTDAEERFKRFLARHLPDSIGITSGEVVDAHGGKSGELDVIVYDKRRTPMLFGDHDSRFRSVPVEGVIAAVEVKSKLTLDDVRNAVKSCRKLKQLQRSAYFQTNPLDAYEAKFRETPVYYGIFAFQSENTYAEILNGELLKDVPREERIDSLCHLDKGTTLNVSIEPGTGVGGFMARPSEGSGLATIEEPEKALLHWYAAFSTEVALAEVPRIDLTHYLKDDLRVQAKMPGETVSENFRVEHVIAEAGARGLRTELLRKVHGNGGPVTFDELVEVLKEDENLLQLGPDAPADERALFDKAKATARAQKVKDPDQTGL